MATAVARPAGRFPGARSAHHEVLIIGGGAAGISVAARLCRSSPKPDVAILEPSDKHYYQPLWTLVAAGVLPKERTERREAGLIPAGATWIRKAAAELLPDESVVVTADGQRIGYDALVVACGVKLDWKRVKGLEGHVGKDAICTNYAYEHCDHAWQTIRTFCGGTALFVMPPPPIKCPGAPQKIAYLADDAFRRQGVRAGSRIIYTAGTPGIFGVPEFARTLEQVVERKQIETMFGKQLVEVRPAERRACFLGMDDGDELTINYDMLYVVPPQRPPEFISRSPLADERGWVEVDRHSLRHPRYHNVFSLGDVCSAPTSKTGAAIKRQAPVLVRNLLGSINGGREGNASYDGYTACPLVTGYGRLVLAEFDYDLTPRPSFPFDTTKERRSMYQLKRHGLPPLYWHGMLKGRF